MEFSPRYEMAFAPHTRIFSVDKIMLFERMWGVVIGEKNISATASSEAEPPRAARLRDWCRPGRSPFIFSASLLTPRKFDLSSSLPIPSHPRGSSLSPAEGRLLCRISGGSVGLGLGVVRLERESPRTLQTPKTGPISSRPRPSTGDESFPNMHIHTRPKTSL